MDLNNDGLLNFCEKTIAGMTVALTGTDILGRTVNRVTQSNAVSVHIFRVKRVSNATGYAFSETQAVGLFDGTNLAGSDGGFAGKRGRVSTPCHRAFDDTGY